MMNNIITTAGSSSAASNNTSVTRGAFESSAYAAMENALEGSTSTPMHNSQARDGTTYAQKLQSLTRLRNKLKEWPSPPILIHVAESLTSDNIIEIDIAETILSRDEGAINAPQAHKRNDDNCYWFATLFNKNDVEYRKTEIIPGIRAACRGAGFKVNCHYNSKKNYIEVNCNRHKYHQEEKNTARNEKKQGGMKKATQQKEKKKKSEKPVNGMEDNDELCPVHFRVYWDVGKNRWFLPKVQVGVKVHCGHKHKDPSDIRLEMKDTISPTDMQIARDAFDSHINISSTQRLLETRTGETPSWQQVYQMRQQQLNKQKEDQKTSCDQLVHYLTTNDDISCTFLFADPETSLLTEKKKKAKRNSALTVEELTTPLHADEADSPATYAKSMKQREQLIHTETGQLMLAAAWTTYDQRRKFDMFPEFASGDDTEGTNSEKRPLYTLLGKDQNEKIFPIAWAFLPSKSLWAYDWFFSRAMPLLHPGDAIQRVELIVTDADPQETSAIANHIGGNLKPSAAELRLFINAFHRWCAWHRINRNFTQDSKYKSLLTKIKNSCVLSRIEVDVLERWLWYFIKNYESNEEVDCCKHLMEIYLNDEMQSSHIGQIDEDDRKTICEFVTKSFNSNQRKLFGAEFVDSMNIGNATTGASEGYHSGIKKSHLGPNANDPMHVTAEKLNNFSGSKEVEKSQRAAYDSNATYGKAKDRKGTVQQFSTFCNNKISSESESSADFFQFRADENTFFIKHNYDKVDMDAAEELGISVEEYNAILCKDESAAAVTKEVELSEEDTKKIETLRGKVLGKGNGTTPDYAKILLESMKYIIPRFERTRVVKLIQLPDGTWILVCLCGLFKQMGYACRHKYKLLRRDPKSSDAKVRWHNGYCEDYGSNDELTSAYMALRSANLPGIPVTDEEAASIKASMQVGSGDKHEDFFHRSLNKLCLRGEKTFWHENADRFQDALQNVAFCVPIQNSVAHGNTALPFPTRGDTNVPTFAGLPSTSFGPTKMIHSTGTRMVPSQREELTNEDNVNAEIDICGDSNAKDLSERFLPHYETICKYAEACGDDGMQVMAKHFDHCQRRFLHFIHNSNVSDNDVAVQTSPKSSNPYHNFKLPYERICSMAQRGGDLGIDAASEEFAACLEELVALAGERNLCTQKVNARRKKVTSPRRSAKKQPRR